MSFHQTDEERADRLYAIDQAESNKCELCHGVGRVREGKGALTFERRCPKQACQRARYKRTVVDWAP